MTDRLCDCEKQEGGDVESAFIKPAKIDDIPVKYPIVLADLDGTLTEPGSQLVLEKFVRSAECKSDRSGTKQELIKAFDEWKEYNRSIQSKIDPDYIDKYEEYLVEIGMLYARLFEGYSRDQVLEMAYNWFRREGIKSIADYSRTLIKKLGEFKTTTVLVTGAPYECAAHYAQELGVEYVFSMESEINALGEFYGEMDREKNTGLGENKAKVREQFSRNSHPIILGMGDSASDRPLWGGGMYDHSQEGEAKMDFDLLGRGVLINPTDTVRAIIKMIFNDKIKNRKLLVIDSGVPAKRVIDTITGSILSAYKDNKKLIERRRRLTNSF